MASQILAKLSERIASHKPFKDVFVKSAAQLENHRALLGQSPPGIRWESTERLKAKELLGAFPDKVAVLRAGISSENPVAVLHAFAAAGWWAHREPKLADDLEFLATALRALDRSDAPTNAEMKAAVGLDGWSAGNMFLDGLEGFLRSVKAHDLVIAAYQASTNPRFRGLLEGYVASHTAQSASPPKRKPKAQPTT